MRTGVRGAIAYAAFAGSLLAGCAGGNDVPGGAAHAPAAAGHQTQGAAARTQAIPKGYTLLYSFAGSPDGADPVGGVLIDPKGNIFGTTYRGGTTAPPSRGAGTMYELKKTKGTYVESVIHDFGADGYNPGAAPTRDGGGNLYTTVESGPANGGSSGGAVELSPSKSGFNEDARYQFASSVGTAPAAPMLEVTDGSSHPPITYGTTLFTTTTNGGAAGYGSLDAFTLGLACSDVHDFQGGPSDGANPSGNLDFNPEFPGDAFYGTTSAGGANGFGTVFQYVPQTAKESVLYSFAGGSTDGAYPFSGTVVDHDGAIYGTTQQGGAGDGGVIFKLTPNPSGGFTESVLHAFGATGDGAQPLSAPVISLKGYVMYGTTSAGGANGLGTIYQISTDGSGYKVLYSFAKSTGATPGYGSLAIAGSAVYGTTQAGGSAGQGVVYRFLP